MNDPHPSPDTCPRCGATLGSDALEGNCPRCLARQQLAAETVPTGGAIPATPPLSPAELAPHFPQLEILECLGRGGMGVVYRARQISLNRIVALKLLAPERVGDPAFAGRFSHEAQALAKLSHPNIVTIHDFGQTGGFFYLLMEFVDGVNLRQAMQAGRFTPEQALAIVPPVCEALQYAHEQGIVHRDIKPENLLLDKAGRVKIADFGVAKMLGGESDAGLAESQPVGTPQYMAPEQKEKGATDHRADIYSLGVVLYEMLTGERPGVRIEPPSRRVQVDVRIDEIVLRALEVQPELRFATAEEFRTQVAAAVHGVFGGSGNKSGMTQGVEAILRVTFTSPLAIKLVNLSALGWLASLGFLGNVPLAGWHHWYGFFGFSGFFGFIGIGVLVEALARRKTPGTKPEGTPETRPGPRRSTVAALSIVWWFTASLWVACGTYLGLFANSVAIPALIMAGLAWLFAWLAQHCASRWEGTPNGRLVMRAFSCLGWLLAVPSVAFAAFFVDAMLSERGGWHPAPAEMIIVPVMWVGAVLLPFAAFTLWRAPRNEHQR